MTKLHNSSLEATQEHGTEQALSHFCLGRSQTQLPLNMMLSTKPPYLL